MNRKSRLFVTDEELGKRDDDHKRRDGASWLPSTRLRIRKRRLAIFAGIVVAIWIFTGRHSPSYYLDGGANVLQASGLSSVWGGAAGGVGAWQRELEDGLSVVRRPSPPRDAEPPVEQRSDDVDDAIPHDFEGPIKFYYLAPTLHQISHTMGHRIKNNNVLFAASDLKSLAAILPLACQMSQWGRNYVHMAVMGRDDISIPDIRRVNGVENPESCNIFWHDARPDYSLFRTDKSMETSVAGALGHIETFMHPQAVIVADDEHEDYFFSKAIHARSQALRQTLIKLPRDHPEKLSWLCRLEAQSLHSWHTALIDIVVQAPVESSGSLVRLLQSLEAADYDGFIPPRLTVELPHKLTPSTKKYLDRFDWPPRRYELLGRDSQFVVRRRIHERRENAEEAALRFIETFYPSSSGNSHVLVLSPQAELSPVFFHYLKYYLLDYRYSSYSKREDPVLGISLESPSLHLNGTGPFDPAIPKMRPRPDVDSVSTPYLWQAPNSNAALYFSERWIELHSYLSRHMTAMYHPQTRMHHKYRTKLVSPRYPSWMESFLDLMRARGYTMIYPSQDPDDRTSTRETLVTIHNELYQPPEEFTASPTATVSDDAPLPTESILVADASYLNTHSSEYYEPPSLNAESTLLRSFVGTLQSAPPLDDDEKIPDANGMIPMLRAVPPANPPLSVLPVLDHNGVPISQWDLLVRGAAVTIDYRRNFGGCDVEQSKENRENAEIGTADDLFCIEPADLPPDFDSFDMVIEDPILHQPTTKPAAKPDAKPTAAPEPPTQTTKQPFGVGGAANTVNAALDWDAYAATAAAGLAKKLGTAQAPAAAAPEDNLALTPAERAELEDWKVAQAKQKGFEGPKPDPRADPLTNQRKPGTPSKEPLVEPLEVVNVGGEPEQVLRPNAAPPSAHRAYPDGDGEAEEEEQQPRRLVPNGAPIKIPVYHDREPVARQAPLPDPNNGAPRKIPVYRDTDPDGGAFAVPGQQPAKRAQQPPRDPTDPNNGAPRKIPKYYDSEPDGESFRVPGAQQPQRPVDPNNGAPRKIPKYYDSEPDGDAFKVPLPRGVEELDDLGVPVRRTEQRAPRVRVVEPQDQSPDLDAVEALLKET